MNTNTNANTNAININANTNAITINANTNAKTNAININANTNVKCSVSCMIIKTLVPNSFAMIFFALKLHESNNGRLQG